MMKKLLFACALFAVSTLHINAQTNNNTRANQQTKHESNNAITLNNSNLLAGITATGCGFISTQTTNSLIVNSVSCSTVAGSFGGYVVGTNCVGDLEKANYFAPSTFSAVTSPSIVAVSVGFFRSQAPVIGTKGTGTVSLKIYNGNMTSGPTGAAISTTTASLTQIVAAQTGTTNVFTYTFNLAAPLVASASGFFAALTIPQTPGDTIVIPNQQTAPTNFGWERQADNNWYDMSSANAWGSNFKANLTIFPIVCGNLIATSISNNAGLKNQVSIMPNPSTGLFNVSVNKTQNLNLVVTNALGQIVVSNNYNAVLNENITLDLSSYSNGIYFVTVSNGTDKMVQRLILSK